MDLDGFKRVSVLPPGGGIENVEPTATEVFDHAGYGKVIFRLEADMTHLNGEDEFSIYFQEADAEDAAEEDWSVIPLDPEIPEGPVGFTLTSADEQCVKFGAIKTLNRKRYFRGVVSSNTVDEGEAIYATLTQILAEPNIVIAEPDLAFNI